MSAFQKYAFYVPSNMRAGDVMLKTTNASDTDLRGAAIEAHLSGRISANKLTLLEKQSNAILTNGATTMNVYEGISGMLPNAMRVEGGNKLIVDRRGTFKFNEDNAKSLVETMAGAATFLGTGANLLTGAGLRSASTEAASGGGFAPFAAIGGSSLRHETGSHVEMKGMNLAVGFSREVMQGDNRILFGPLVEYGLGTYDSYVNTAHGDGTISYIGMGGFLRKETQNGRFYEGSLRFGQSKMDYDADITMGFSKVHTFYDTDTNYLGAHLGIGQQITTENGNKREIYLRYFYTHQNGSSTTLSTGEQYDFSDVDSHRLHTGARWTLPKKGGALVLGASVQYEFGGDTSATYHRPGGISYTSPSPSLKGFSSSIEIGWETAMKENATANVSLEGWAGKQRGVTLKAGCEWKF